MKDLNYFPLDVESNIYGMTTLEFDDRTSKVLVATLDCQIYCINYNKHKPHTREVEFTYIPNGAKIISIGALKRGTNDFVIGITHSLAPSAQKREVGDYSRLTTYYFNIYASGLVSSNFDLDYVAQGCQTIRLRYVPYHLNSTELISYVDTGLGTIKKKPFWLLTGGDNCVHAFCEDRQYQSFTEVPIDECFPELAKISGLALWIDVLNLQDTQRGYERVVALGFEDGSVKLYHSILSKSSAKYELVRESSFDQYTTIIPSVRLFRVKSTAPSSLRQKLKSRNLLTETNDPLLEQLNLLVTSSTNPSIVFQDVINSGLDIKYELPESCRLDCATSSAISDTNIDGLNEILIGTHGRELLTYQFEQTSGNYCLDSISVLNYPIYALTILDLTGDALNDVVVLLANGVLILQASVVDVIDICRRRVEALLSLLIN